MPSCRNGVFRNPERESVGRLIENVGLKGATCGAAQISELHANFIVNRGGARAVEVLALIHAVQDAVGQRYGIELVPEVRFLGFGNNRPTPRVSSRQRGPQVDIPRGSARSSRSYAQADAAFRRPGRIRQRPAARING